MKNFQSVLAITLILSAINVGAQTTGCTDSIAYNYDTTATLDDGSCSYCDYMDNDWIEDVYYSAISCNGSNDGSIFGIDLGNSILDNGTGPFTYSVDSGLTFQSSTTFSDLSPGNYYITYMDANGCINPNTSQYWLILFNPDSMQFTTSQNDVSCNGGNDGNMMIDVQYVNYYPYNLQWSDGSTDSVMNNVTAGNYNVVITDANNCSDTVQFNISEAIEIATSISTSNVSCVGGSDGAASISSSGGTPPFTYLWSDGQSGNTASNLSEGSYQVFVTDSANCLDTAYFSIGSSSISISISTTNVSCNGNDGAADASVSGGTAPYSYAWYFEYPGYGYIPAYFQEDISNVPSGTYFVVVTDANGCSVNSDTITLIVDDVLINTLTSDVSCNGGNDGSIDVFVTGGLLPYTYSWSNGSNTEDLINITAANYSITVTDANNCSITESYVVNEPAQLNVSAILTPVTTDCDGSIDLSVNGGTQPFSFAWQLPSSSITDSFSVTSASSTASHPYYSYGPFQVYEIDGVQGAELTLIRGETYYFTMDNIPFFHPFYISTDMFGGQGGSFVGQVTAGVSNLDAPGTYSATAYQTLSFTPDSSHSDTLFYQCGNHMYMGYRLIITDGITSEDLSGLCEGTYDLTITDANNCIVSESYFISGIVYGCTDPLAPNYDPLVTQDDGSCACYPILDSLSSFTACAGDTIEYFGSFCGTEHIVYEQNGNTVSNNVNAFNETQTGGQFIMQAGSGTITLVIRDNTVVGNTSAYQYSNTIQFNHAAPQLDSLSTFTACAGDTIEYFGSFCGTEHIVYEQNGNTVSNNVNAFNETQTGGQFIMQAGSGTITLVIRDNTVVGNTSAYQYSNTIQLSYCILGCTNPMASNYNVLANTDDGSCIINGCTDSTAFNYNPIATQDDGSCFAIVLGCTDSTAANFNPLANTDDGSCSVCADNYVNIQIITANYGSEVAWELVDENGNVVADGGCQSFPGNCYNSNTTYDNWLCLPTACYTLNLYDMFGDGWSGGTYAILDANGTTYAYGTLSSGSSLTVTDIGIPFCAVLGCTDPTATNYNATANTDDGSCYTIQCVETLPYTEDFELGPANPRITLSSASNSSSSIDGYAAKDGNYGWHGEGGATWNGGTPSSGQNAFNTKPDNISTMNICVDLDAIVYNPSDVYHLKFDLKQEYSYNANYSWFRVQADNAAISDNNGITYFQPNTPSSDSWQEIIYDVTSYISMGVFDFDFQTCNKYSYGYFNNGDNGYVDNILIYKVIYGCTDITMSNYNALANTDDGTCEVYSYGCTDPTALNYDVIANTDDGSCTFCYAVADIGADTISACDSVLLSTNPITNGTYLWNSSNISSFSGAIGDTYQGGVVFYLDGNGGGLIAAPSDQASGGSAPPWGPQNTYSGANGTAIGTGYQNTIYSETAGSAASLCLNLTLGGYSDWFLPSKDEVDQMYLNIGQGNALGLGNIGGFDNTTGSASAWVGMYWSSTEYNKDYGWCKNFSTNANTPGQWTGRAKNVAHRVRAIRAISPPINTDTTNSVMVSTSGWNYVTVTDSLGCTATDSVYVNIQNCIYGCTDALSNNYNPLATIDDGSCIYPIYGCTDPAADNYDATATVDDGSCTYTAVCANSPITGL
ncbi:hypothetical protein N9K38_00990, partial [Flavobacteriales bacterium]|nr:hypothetical protein [Flavobacteriales bacterium]